MPQKVAILGSTGSIGKQALDIVSRYPDDFKVTLLTAGNNIDLLTSQALKFHPESVVISNRTHLNGLRENLKGTGMKVLGGEEAIEHAVSETSSDILLAALVGFCGLKPVIAGIKSGKKIALANKETLVVAGEIITKLASTHGSRIIPVDSEHSAIFQCLEGEDKGSVEKITLTASGGPFRDMPAGKIRHVTPADALKHPNWNMGDKITIDSASMMNKGLEVIEAKWLFDLAPGQISVTIHPQSIIHSLVHFTDGSVKAQMSLPDMRLPILYALGYPGRIKSELPRLELNDQMSFTFSKPDLKKFRNLSLAYEALNRGGNTPCVLSAANEIAVSAFLSGMSSFTEMSDIVEYSMEKSEYIASPDLECLEATDKAARNAARDYIQKLINKK